MPAVYTVTARRRAWKQHTCCACGCAYRCEQERSATGGGRAAEVAREKAAAAALQKVHEEADVRPCPTCGLVQPDMAAGGKAKGHALVALPALAALGLAVALGHIPGALTADEAAPAAAAIAGLATLAHFLIARRNPNRNRDANRERAEAEVAAGRVEVVRPGRADEPPGPDRSLTRGNALALLGMALTIPAFLLPLYLRPADGWPLNPGQVPAMVGPGDSVTLFVPSPRIRAVQGLWRAAPEVEVLNAAEAGCPAVLPAASGNDSWGGLAWSRSYENERPVRLFARVSLPDDPGLAGKALRLRVTLPVTFPAATADQCLQDRKAVLAAEFTVRVAPGEVRRTYAAAWGAGAAAGLFGYLLCGLVLAFQGWRLPSRAEPSEFVPAAR